MDANRCVFDKFLFFPLLSMLALSYTFFFFFPVRITFLATPAISEGVGHHSG